MTVNDKKVAEKSFDSYQENPMENCHIWIVSEIYFQPASFGITLLFHFSERAGKAAGTRKSSRLSIA